MWMPQPVNFWPNQDNHNNYIIGPLGETINLRAYMDTRPNKVLEL